MDMKQIATELRGKLDAKRAEAQQLWTTFDTERKSFLEAVAKKEVAVDDEAAFKKLDDLSKPYDAVKADIVLLEQKWAQAVGLAGLDVGAPTLPGGAPSTAPAGPTKGRGSLGQRYVESDGYKVLKESGSLDTERAMIPAGSQAKVTDRDELKRLLSPINGVKTLLDSSQPSAGDLVVNDHKPGVVLLGQPGIVVLDVITLGETDSDTVEYVREETFTNAAAETAEGVAAPETTLAYELITQGVEELTHFIPGTKRILSDAGQLRTLVDSRMIYGVRKRLQAQIFNGDGTSPNLRGILQTSGINSQALGTDSRSDAVHKAMTLIRLDDESDPSVIAGNPADFEQLFLEKDLNGNYIYGPPSQSGPRTIWGLTPIQTTAITAGTFLVGDYSAATLWLREGATISVSDSHDDFFVKRKVAILATMRAAFGVTRKNAFAEVTGV